MLKNPVAYFSSFFPLASLAPGFIHEQTRPDRDEYVIINWQNIKKGEEHNFRKHESSNINTLDVPYDFGSLMHYGKTFYSVNGKETITPKDKTEKNSFNSLPDRLSVADLKKLNKFYNCSGKYNFLPWVGMQTCKIHLQVYS